MVAFLSSADFFSSKLTSFVSTKQPLRTIRLVRASVMKIYTFKKGHLIWRNYFPLKCWASNTRLGVTIRRLAKMSKIEHDNKMPQSSRGMGFPTIWYVRPAKPQISLRIRAV